MSQNLIRNKGIADIIVATIIAVKPATIYESFVAKMVHSWTGLHISDASLAPGFNHSIACMVAAVGVGFIVASRSGSAVHPAIFAMTLSWSVLGFLTCATPRAWGLGSATLLMTSFNHLLFSLAMYWKDPRVLSPVVVGQTRKVS
ncbi:hypothetical protein B0H34DRAFT_648646 [Crassisporium funariophilum]|nr:hypothetical protein B0H34DRAFT_648646 [Crassisporium funariophilum]